MSKTFKSVTDNKSELDVRANDCGVFIAFSRAGQIRQASTFAPSDAPALALAILEAAGFKAEFHATGTFQDGDCWQLENVAQVIKDYLSIKDAEAAEAKEQAELEAEALELYNVCMTGHNLTSFDGLGGALRDQWLAVARKAREMRKS